MTTPRPSEAVHSCDSYDDKLCRACYPRPSDPVTLLRAKAEECRACAEVAADSGNSGAASVYYDDARGEEAQRIAWMIRNRPAQAVVQEKKT